MCLEQLKTLTEISANIATDVGIISGIIGAISVIRQWRLSNAQWRFQRYEKFHAVYRANLDFINASIAGRLSNQLMSEYARDVMGHDFLVGQEIRAFYDEVYSKANILLTCQSMVQNERDSTVKANLQKRQEEILQWFVSQPAKAKELFHKHLKIED